MTEPYRVDALSIEDGMAMAMWRYPGPWAVYDSLEAPRARRGLVGGPGRRRAG